VGAGEAVGAGLPDPVVITDPQAVSRNRNKHPTSMWDGEALLCKSLFISILLARDSSFIMIPMVRVALEMITCEDKALVH
jgi:hypothetical protein